jgi:hypothetical protein
METLLHIHNYSQLIFLLSDIGNLTKSVKRFGSYSDIVQQGENVVLFRLKKQKGQLCEMTCKSQADLNCIDTSAPSNFVKLFWAHLVHILGAPGPYFGRT